MSSNAALSRFASDLGTTQQKFSNPKNHLKPCIHEHAEWFENRSQMVREPNVRTCGWDCEPALCRPQKFAYRSLRTEICQFFARTQRELDVPGVLFMHRVSFARLRFAEN